MEQQIDNHSTEIVSKVEELTKLGCFNEYGVIQPPPTDPIILARIEKIMST